MAGGFKILRRFKAGTECRARDWMDTKCAVVWTSLHKAVVDIKCSVVWVGLPYAEGESGI